MQSAPRSDGRDDVRPLGGKLLEAPTRTHLGWHLQTASEVNAKVLQLRERAQPAPKLPDVREMRAALEDYITARCPWKPHATNHDGMEVDAIGKKGGKKDAVA